MGFLKDIFGGFISWFLPDQPKPEIGTDLTFAATDEYIPVQYGRGYGTGLIVFQATNDGDDDDVKNDLLHHIVVWGEGQCGGVVKNYVDDDLSTSSRFKGKGSGRWFYAVNFTNGLGAYSDPLLTQAGLRATDRFAGKMLSYLRSEMTRSDVFSGMPEHKAEWLGRLISTPSGGALTASENPASQLYDYLKSPIYGKGLTDDFIDVASFQAAQQYCDELVKTFITSGVYRKRFTSNVRIDTSKPVIDNVNMLAKAMRGLCFISNGKVKIIIEKDDPAVDFTIDDQAQGFIEWGSITNSSKSNRYNRVIVEYMEPNAGWTKQEATWPPIGSPREAELLAEDNGVLLEKTIKLETCIYFAEAIDFAKTFLEKSRQQLSTSVTWGPEATLLEVGDIVPVNRAAVGWVGKLFRIINTKESLTEGEVELSLLEHQPYIYAQGNEDDYQAIPDTNLTFSQPAVPTGPVSTAVFNDFAQIQLSWTSTTVDHHIEIYNASNVLLINTDIGRTNYNVNNLPLGTYSVKVWAIGGLGISSESALEFTFDITVPATPTGIPNVKSKPGFITVEPPTPQASVYTYEWRWHTSLDATLIAGGRDSVKTITPVIADVTYTIEYRLITELGAGAWVSVDVNGLERIVYTWKAYADDETGTGISLSPTGKAYYGIAINQAVETPSIADPSVYIWILQDAGSIGTSPVINAILSNESSSVSTDKDGNGGDFSGVVTTMTVLEGVVNDTGAYTITATPSAGVTGSLAGSTYTVTNMTTYSGYVDLTATRTDYPTITKRFTITKNRQGVQGIGQFTLVNSANCTIVGNTVTKTSGIGSWNGGAYSIEKYPACFASARGSAGHESMFGLNSDGPATSGYADLDYAIYFASTFIQVYESGTPKHTVNVAYLDTDVFSVVCDGSTVKYLKNGALFYTSDVAPTGTYGFDCSLVSASLTNVAFGPIGSTVKNMFVSADAQAFTFDKNGTLFGASTITITASPQNLTGTISWATVPAGVGTANGNIYTITNAQFGANTSVKVTATQGGISDSTTISRLQDGATGESAAINLATSKLWQVGTGSAGGLFGGNFDINGDGNVREWRTDQWGKPAIVWVSKNNDVDSDADGGWNKIIDIDHSKSYMSVVYFRRVSDSVNGQFYHGCGGSTHLDGSIPGGGGAYFNVQNLSFFDKDEWYVSIGIINSSDTTGTSPSAVGGVYRLKDGKKVSGSTEFRHTVGQATQLHRTYLYYSTDPNAEVEWVSPGFYEINGDEPSINQLIGKPGSSPITVILSNENHTLPADTAGNVLSFAGSGTEVHCYEGSTELIYDGVGTAAGTWKFVSTNGTNVTGNGVVDSGNYVTVNDIVGLSADTGALTYVVTGKKLDGTAFTAAPVVQSFSKARQGTGQFTLLNTANCTINGNTITKSAGAVNGWDAAAYSLEKYPACFASAKLPAYGYYGFGLSSSPGNVNFGTTQYEIYRNANNILVIESGNTRGDFGAVDPNAIYSVVCDGFTVKYLKNGDVFYTSEVTPSSSYSFDCAIHNLNISITQVAFGPGGTKGNTGSNGLSAYEVWLAAGNSGSMSAFLASLNGGDGVDGNTWHDVASGEPPPALGAINDFALSAGRFVYKKTGATTWTYKTDLIGTPGTDGKTPRQYQVPVHFSITATANQTLTESINVPAGDWFISAGFNGGGGNAPGVSNTVTIALKYGSTTIESDTDTNGGGNVGVTLTHSEAITFGATTSVSMSFTWSSGTAGGGASGEGYLVINETL